MKINEAQIILGVAPSATDDEIKTAFRRAAMRAHPDRGGSIAEFQKVNKAFEILRDRICPECNNKGFIEEPRGPFIDKRNCPRCWSRKA